MDTLLDFLGDVHCQVHVLFIMCDIKESLIKRDRLHQVGVIVKDTMDRCRDLAVDVIASRSNDKIGTLTLGQLNRHRRVHTIFAGLIARCGHHAP